MWCLKFGTRGVYGRGTQRPASSCAVVLGAVMGAHFGLAGIDGAGLMRSSSLDRTVTSEMLPSRELFVVNGRR